MIKSMKTAPELVNSDIKEYFTVLRISFSQIYKEKE